MFDQVLWFTTRGAGAVSLLMFTASAALGLVTVARFQAAGWPRFFNYEMHRRVSLLSIVFLAVHVLTAVFDPFTKLGLGAALVPFASSYRPVQVALGVVALYLFVALIVLLAGPLVERVADRLGATKRPEFQSVRSQGTARRGQREGSRPALAAKRGRRRRARCAASATCSPTGGTMCAARPGMAASPARSRRCSRSRRRR